MKGKSTKKNRTFLEIKKKYDGGVAIDDSKINKEITETEVDPVDEIIKWKELLDIGAIKEEEYQRVKNKCLDQLIKLFMEI